jgi:3-phosphoshikimate 1-carboxyvinyltransferase
MTEAIETKTVTVSPAKGLEGALRLPGDKSISHRYAMLGALSEGTTRLENYSTGKDCASTLGCMRELGCEWTKTEKGRMVAVEMQGTAGRLRAPVRALDCGNSGSTMRMLSGIVAGQPFASEMVGDESLSRRPMARVIKPLTEMGARIAASAGDRPPLRVTGGQLRAIDYKMPVASAQVKSCLLFAGLFAEGETRVEEPVRTRDHGELALRAFGAELKRERNVCSIRGGQKLRAIEATVPGDLSSAAFFVCAAALFPNSELAIDTLGMNPTRARLLDILIQMGVEVAVTQLEEQHGELVGTLQVRGGKLRGVMLAGADTAALIDEIPVLSAIAPYTDGGMEIRDASELRVKESDRIAAIATNLRAMGAEVEERPDGLRIPGGQRPRGADIQSFGDHRIAMAFAVAGLRAEGETRIHDAQCADISFPGFFELLDQITAR